MPYELSLEQRRANYRRVYETALLAKTNICALANREGAPMADAQIDLTMCHAHARLVADSLLARFPGEYEGFSSGVAQGILAEKCPASLRRIRKDPAFAAPYGRGPRLTGSPYKHAAKTIFPLKLNKKAFLALTKPVRKARKKA